MKQLSIHDLPAIAPKAVARLAGEVQKQSVIQGAAATATLHLWTAEYDGVIGEAVASIAAAAAAGESVTVNVKKNGATIMAGGAAALVNAKVIDLTPKLDKDKVGFKEGDVFTVDLTYTAGGAPTPIANTRVTLKPTFASWKY